MSSMINSLPMMSRPSEAKAVASIADFVNYDINKMNEFPTNALSVGPMGLIQVLERLFDNTVEDEKDRFTPYFIGDVKSNIDEVFVRGLCILCSLRHFYDDWICPRATNSNGNLLEAGMRAEFTSMTYLENPSVPIPLQQTIGFRVVYVCTATLKTKPNLIPVFIENDGFQLVANLITKDWQASDTLQKVFCEFVGYFQTDKLCLKAMLKADYMKVLISLSKCKSKVIGSFASNLLSSVDTNCSKLSVSTSENNLSIDEMVDNLCCPANYQGMTRHTLLRIINDNLVKTEDLRDKS